MACVLAHHKARRLRVLLAAGVAAALGIAVVAQQEPADRRDAAVIDIVATGPAGRFVDDLSQGDVAVFVDGVRRSIESIRRVSRGPGAGADAASRQSAMRPGVGVAAEGQRTVVVVIDRASILRGDEREAIAAAGLFIDRLGLDDRIAVLGIPLRSGARLALTSERPELRGALAGLVGELAPAPISARVELPPSLPDDQARMAGLETDQPISVDPTSAASPGDAWATRPGAGSLAALRAILSSLHSLPGRKVVAVFSAGLPHGAEHLVHGAAQAAAAARAVVYGFALHPSSGADPVAGLSQGPLERLAAATGGFSLSLGRRPDRAIDRIATEIGACYAVSLAPPGADAVRLHELRLETTRKGVSLRGPAWLARAPDAGDRLLEPGKAATGETAAPAAAAPPSGPGSTAALPPTGRKPDPELDLALGRLFDYADGYERRYSMLVAEEDYKQSASRARVHLRSDVLLVRPDEGGEWTSFRDVFEVDGRPVRDREERLRRLFLDATPEAISRLQAIGRESARYNVGSIERTVNVPLLPFRFLRPSNRRRFQFELDGRHDAGGVPVWRVRYTERERPTLVADKLQRDVPVAGWFLVDTVTGAVVETRMSARQKDAWAEIVVRYRRDPLLGLWVPAEMRELYSQPIGVARPGLDNREVVDGRATYSNYRRFLVTTEEKIAPPK